MTIRNLDRLFRPKSVVLVGASLRPHAVGAVIARNLSTGSFKGQVWAVNPKHSNVLGIPCYNSVSALPGVPDLAVICTPPATIPKIIDDLGRKGCRAAICITAGLSAERMPDGRTVEAAMLEASRPYLLRILGPNCVGLLVPEIGLNASFAHASAAPGTIAFVSQSGALCTAVLDWANAQHVGFSHFVSLGDSSDVDFGDVLDWLALDPSTNAILLYVESVKHARKFISAARSAARNKPIIAVKSGRNPEAARAAASHTGALAGGDDVFSAAFRRAGILRVDSTEELFEVVETLARARRLMGERLAILTNGGGPGVMAVDALIGRGGKLAELPHSTIEALSQGLPSTWSKGNPVDVIGDAPAERYSHALKVLDQDQNSDAILVLHAPTAIVPSIEPARAVVEFARHASKPILTCWLGRDAVKEARDAFMDAGLPTYDTPDAAARAYSHMVEYRRSQEMLLQTPDEVPDETAARRNEARKVINAALDDGRDMLTEPEAKTLIASYGIPVIRTEMAKDEDEAVSAAEAIGYPVALKIISPEITHKTEAGGVALDIKDSDDLRQAARLMMQRAKKFKPGCRIDGYAVEAMARRPMAFEIILGIATDPVFGPVILFGQGGTAVEVVRDRGVALPPLNMSLARDLVEGTRISRLLRGYRDHKPVDFGSLCGALVHLSQLAADLPEVVELDINPLFVDDKGVIALDARVKLRRTDQRGATRFAIRPYPQHLEEMATLRDGSRVTLRPIRPEDEPAHMDFFSRLNNEDIRYRFFGLVRDLPHTQMARFTQIDYDREMAFIATRPIGDGARTETLGVVRTVTDPDNTKAEYAIIVRSDLKGRGLGFMLMQKMIRYCRERGTLAMTGTVLAENKAMRKMVENLGFTTERGDPDCVEVKLDLSNVA